MTTPSTPRKAGPLLGTGAQTSWPFTFKVFAASDIAVTIANNLGVETALVLNADYSVTLNSNQDTSPGGTVTYPISGSALPVGSKLTIIGNLPYDQPLDLPSGGNFSPLALENELDRLTMQIQQLREQVGRSLTVPVTSGVSPSLPSPAASNIIGWNENGDNLENYPLSELATSLAFATFRYDTFTGDGSTTQFTLSADPVTLGNLDVAVGGVTQTPVADYLLVGGVIEFTSAPPLGVTILARFGEGIASGPSMDSYDVRFRQAGTGAVDRTAEAKMREIVSVKDFGAVGDGVADDTLAIQNAFTAANGKTLDIGSGTYLIVDQITMPANIHVVGSGKFICTGDEQYWFYADTPERVVWDSFVAEITLAFGSRTQLNRVLVCNAPEYFEVKTATITGASTAIQSINGDDFVCGEIILFDVYGTAAQYGYGINTSAKRNTVDSVRVVNSSAADGRHAVYVNGSQWTYAAIGDIYVNNWAGNPVQIVNTDASAYAYASVDNAVFNNCNQAPTAATTGCIHVPDDATNTGLNIGSLRVKNIKGPAASSLAQGDAGFWLGTLFADDLPQAANAATMLVYLRFGSNKQVGNVFCSELNTDWTSAVYIRDCTDAILNQLFVGGSAGSQAATFVNCPAAIVGSITTTTISKVLNSGSTLQFSVPIGQGSNYLQGSWTVELYDAASGGNVSPTTATGYYTKIGNMVTVNFAVSNIDTTGMTSGNALHFTLPFTSASTIGSAAGSVVLDSIAFPAGRTYANLLVGANAARGVIACSGTGVTDANVLVSGLTSGTSDSVRASMTYFV